MVDWTSPIVGAQLAAAMKAILAACIGITFREQISMLSFDWSILSGKRSFRAPQVAYFVAKLAWWGYVVSNAIPFFGPGPYDCQALMHSIEAFMALITLASSFLLACRTVCVYQADERRYVTWTLYLLAAGLAATWFAGISDVTATWLPQIKDVYTNGTCVATEVKQRYFAKYVMTIFFDAVVLVLTIIGVMRLCRSSGTRLGALLIDQGLVYFILTFLVNLLVTVFTILDYSPVMDLFFAIPASCICMSTSTRLYYQLVQEAAHRPAATYAQSLDSHRGNADKVVQFLGRRGRSTTATSATGLFSPQETSSTAKSNDVDIEKQSTSDYFGASVSILRKQ